MSEDVKASHNATIIALSGLTAVVGPCDPRYYCPEGSHRIDQELCPMGYYCPLATQYPEPCRNGTWSNETGLMDVSECMPCTEGYYCNGFALTEPSGPCTPGYYCPTGSEVSTQVNAELDTLFSYLKVLKYKICNLIWYRKYRVGLCIM